MKVFCSEQIGPIMTSQILSLLKAQLHYQDALIAAQSACISEQNTTIRELQEERVQAFPKEAVVTLQDGSDEVFGVFARCSRVLRTKFGATILS